jgi:hypothetical protein
VAWQFAGADPERRERRALRVIACSFFALAAYVSVEAVRALLGAVRLIDPWSDRAGGRQRRGDAVPVLRAAAAGRELGSASAVADSKQTLLCTYLSAAVLAGLVLNAALGWWWADPVAALLLAALASRKAGRRGAESCAARVVQARGTDGGCSDGCCT